MAKKKKQNKETTIGNYYDLKTKEMDDLVAALKGEDVSDRETPSYNIADAVGKDGLDPKDKNKQFDPYKIDKMSRIPTWVKACFAKFWAAGVVCYLFLWGLQGVITSDTFALALIDGVMMGVVTDIFVNSAFQHFQSSEREYDAYMMFPFPFKMYWTFFANIAYYVFINILIFVIANLIGNYVYSGFGLGPILFGLFNLVIDMAFISIKNLIVHLVKKRKQERELDV